MTELFEAADQLWEEAFPPKPGGLVDRHRQRKADEAAEAAERENTEERIEQPSYKATKVAPIAPSVFSPAVFNIAAGTAAQILPLSPYRFRTTVRIVTAASTIVLGKDQGAAVGGNGYTMVTADQPLPLTARAQLWAFNPGGAVVQVCVISEIYGPEQ